MNTHSLPGSTSPLASYAERPYSERPSVQRAPTCGSHPLVLAAEPILTLLSHIRRTLSHPEPNKLRSQLVTEMKKFQKRMQDEGLDRRLSIAAHYCLCVAMDEAVLKTAWGHNSVWVEQGLLSTFHKETQGGERFYIILKHAMDHTKSHIGLIELMYLCLSLGYEGQYFGKDKMLREEIRNKAFYHLQRYYGKQGRALSPHSEDTQLMAVLRQKKSSLQKRLAWSFGIFFVTAGILNLSLQVHSNKTVSELKAMATESPNTMLSPLISRPIRKVS